MFSLSTIYRSDPPLLLFFFFLLGSTSPARWGLFSLFSNPQHISGPFFSAPPHLSFYFFDSSHVNLFRFSLGFSPARWYHPCPNGDKNISFFFFPSFSLAGVFFPNSHPQQHPLFLCRRSLTTSVIISL